jgi:hypothetical protein
MLSNNALDPWHFALLTLILGALWPLLTGQVTQVAVFHERLQSTVTISYTYAVPDEPYSVPAETQRSFSAAGYADAWADALTGKTIPVRVNPAKSWQSEVWQADLDAIVLANAPAGDSDDL